MVAHDITDASFLLPALIWLRAFFEEKCVDHVFRDVIELFANQRIQGGAMSHGGSFDRSGAGQELYVGWRKRREVVPSNTDLIQGFKEPTNVSPVVWDRSRSTQRCRARRRWQSAVRKGFVNGTDVVSIAAPPRSTIEIAYNQVNVLTKHNGTDCENELFRNTPFFGRVCLCSSSTPPTHRDSWELW